MFEPPPVSKVDVLASPDSVAAELATSLPRGEDISALLLLEVDALSDAGRVDLLVAFERHIALLHAAQQQVLASLDGRVLDWSGKKVTPRLNQRPLVRHVKVGEPGRVGEDVDLDDATARDSEGHEGGRSAVRQGEHPDTAVDGYHLLLGGEAPEHQCASGHLARATNERRKACGCARVGPEDDVRVKNGK
jgi:hypothetical protein